MNLHYNLTLISCAIYFNHFSILSRNININSYVTNYIVNLTFIGRVKLKHIAIVSIVLDLILIPQGNAGGHIAHLGESMYQIEKYVQVNCGGTRLLNVTKEQDISIINTWSK